MTTNHIQQLTPGTGCYAFFLNDKGRILADANILCRPDYFLLDVEPETREPLYQHLDHFIIADDVTLEDITDATATIAVEGPEAAEVLRTRGRAGSRGRLFEHGLGQRAGRAAQLHRQPRILHLCARQPRSRR